jgi:hypothetical protein
VTKVHLVVLIIYEPFNVLRDCEAGDLGQEDFESIIKFRRSFLFKVLLENAQEDIMMPS